MALLPRSTTTLKETGGGQALDRDLAVILSCMQSGTDENLQAFTSVQDIQDMHGYGEGLELAARYVTDTDLAVMFGKLATVTAGAIGPTNVKSVTGTSAITFSGTPYDDEAIQVVVVTGGTIGVAGIELKISRDGGRTFSANVRLGTATSYAIPATGVTVNFAAGTLVAADIAYAYCTSPKTDSTGLTALFTKLKLQARLPRLLILCGDVDGTLLDTLISEVAAYETSAGRHMRVICNLRDQYAPAVAQGTFTVSTSQVGKTYTRNTGSYVTDGFKVGMRVTFAGFVNSASNGVKTLTTVTATVLTVTEAIGADEAAVTSTTASGTESKSTWRAALDLVVNGATPGAAKVSHRTLARGGRARNRSVIDGRSFKRRPAAWADAIATMSHDLQISSARYRLEGWSITDANGVLVEHDENVDGGLLASRIGGLRTHDGVEGVFVSLPLSLDTDNAPLSRAPVGFVADLVCSTANASWTRHLNRELDLNASGYISEAEAKRLEGFVLEDLKSVLLTPGPEGTRISADESAGATLEVSFPRNIDLRTPGTLVPTEVGFVPKGYLEQIRNTVRVRTGGT